LDSSPGERSNVSRSRTDIRWAEFDLLRLVIFWLLGLLSVIILFVPVVVILVTTGRIGPAIGIGTLVGGTLACIGRLLNNSLKPILRIKE